MSNALTIVKHFFPDVEGVKDATSPLRIEVTSADNNRAAVKKHKDCALAVACKRTFDCDGVIISRAAAYVVKNKKATRYKLPLSAQREIVSFDRNAGFEVGQYHLAPPSPTSRLGASKAYKHSGPSGRGPKVVHVTRNVRARI